MKKRILSVLLVLMLLTALMPATLADTTTSGTCGKDLTWTLEDGVLTISGEGWMADYSYGTNALGVWVTTAPWRDSYKSITSLVINSGALSIGTCAFYGCSNLTSVTIPDGVTTIGDSAFANCRGLTRATIPNSVTTIGNSAFNGCSSLTSVEIPDGVPTIGDSAFSGCSSLTSVTIPDGVTTIGDSAFSGCSSLTSVTIPDGVTEIGNYAFDGCSGLMSVTIPDGVTTIGERAFRDCSGLTSVTIPDSVTMIGNGAFNGCSSLTSMAIPDGVTTIGEYAFNGCSSLTSVTIPNSVTEMGWGAFYGCSSLTSVAIPNGVTTISAGAFYGCSSLTSVTIPNSVTTIGSSAFYGCSSLTSVTIPNSVTEMGWGAFYGCSSLTSVTIPDSVTEMGWGAFYGCSSLTSVTIPNSVTTIGDSAFNGCSSLKSVTLPANIESIGSTSFKGCAGLETITIPDKVKTIEKSAFFGCSSLKMVNLPVSVTLIDERAFEYCGSISTVNYAGTLAQWNAINFTYYNEALTKCKNISIKDHTHSYANGACSGCGATDPNGSQTTPPEQGHTHNYAASVVKPTCTTAGYTVYTCAGCGSSYNDAYTSALGHDYKNGACTRCRATDPNYTKPTEPGHTHSYTTKVVDPTCTAPGYSGDKYCTVCKQTVEKGTEVKALGHNYVGGVCSTCGATNSMRNPFKDVDKTTHADYYDAILWAYYNDITKGTNAAGDMFSPELGCTRAQIVTFLWRQSGAPVVEVANPFVDVDKVKHSDYYNAILWGYSTGVIKGVSDTEFAPDKVCIRAEIVTMLYRLDGENEVKTGTQFTDLTQVWYKDAIAWAVAEKITKGTSDTTFTPDAPCTRAQTVTFLYRYFA